MPAPEATSDRTAALEEENRHLKEDYDSIKWLLQIVAMEKTSTLKNETPDHDLDTVPLDHVGKKMLQSCYDLAQCLMRHRKATEPVCAPPTTHEHSRIEGFFDVCDTPPNDSAGSQIQQLFSLALEVGPRLPPFWITRSTQGLKNQHGQTHSYEDVLEAL
ncbi:hypothetical protein PSHT_15339 [Puccinia striiformis]|uniref:Uncharacterized protein n=1 Tax=Puccinia striiformis TaxID=27350 RepID=A0A2S4UFH6_9BASI|nr:hypothetical protein PSHT_15339 [Puccinia striiformis]